MPRTPPKRPKVLTEVLHIRLPPELLELLDKEVEQQRRSRHGLPTTRADVARQLLIVALEHVDAERKPKKR